jgi:hypothetical protein
MFQKRRQNLERLFLNFDGSAVPVQISRPKVGYERPETDGPWSLGGSAHGTFPGH